jgi:hypothetical protein
MCCLGRIRDSKVYCEANGGKPPCVSRGSAFTVEWADVPYYQGVHTALAGSQQQSGFNSGTNHFELTLFSDGNIKLQYKDMASNPNAWSPPSVGVENGNGAEGMQISYGDPTFPKPNSAFLVTDTCGRSQSMASIGWCPSYNAQSCDFAYADNFCQKNYGGQLISIEDQVSPFSM